MAKEGFLTMTINTISCTGYFYMLGSIPCRKYLNIRLDNTNKKEPDIVFVMMNPGGSLPLEEGDDGRREVPAQPDRTQEQIVILMRRAGFQFARVLNLSDVRQPDSNKFYKFLDGVAGRGLPHSIFDHRRSDELNDLMIDGVPIVLAWGVDKRLEDLSIMALDLLPRRADVLGWAKDDIGYYHPLPKDQERQLRWLDIVADQLKCSLP
jgi:hypothetical protein